MKTPQILILAYLFLNLLVSAYLHGKEKRENVFSKKDPDDVQKYNFWHSLVFTIIMISLLLWGGFFSK